MHLDYDPNSLCGPIDPRAVRILEQRHGKVLDSSYLAHIEEHHAGTPVRQYFSDARGTTHRIGRFLPLFDNRSELTPPFRRSPDLQARDARIEWGILTLIEEDAPSAWHLFGGDKLLPFAALYRGSRHPDTLSLADGQANLLAFLYDGSDRPRIVVWLAEQARAEYERWSNAAPDVNPFEHDEPVRYGAFTVAVVRHFDEFLGLLRAAPGSAATLN